MEVLEQQMLKLAQWDVLSLVYLSDFLNKCSNFLFVFLLNWKIYKHSLSYGVCFSSCSCKHYIQQQILCSNTQVASYLS